MRALVRARKRNGGGRGSGASRAISPGDCVDPTFITARPASRAVAESEGPARGSSWSVKERYGASVKPEVRDDEAPPVASEDVAPSASARKPWWVWAGAALVTVLFIGTAIGVTSLIEDRLVSCAADEIVHPFEKRCATDSEVCTAWMKKPQRYTPTQCPFLSKDGNLGYTLEFKGTGTVLVALDMPDGENIYNRGWGGSEEAVDLNETVKGLRGPAGTWMLRVTFVEASGTATIRAYG